LEYGNIGNYYIIEPLFRELHRIFPEASINTTFQMTEEFCQREKVNCLPMDIYYSWSEHDVNIALKEYAIVQLYNQTGKFIETTPYLEEVKNSDIVIDISGEMWGDKANAVGKDRMLVNLLKMRSAQLLKKYTILYAVSAGPFSDETTNKLAKTTFENFDLVTIRECETTRRLRNLGFNINNAKELPCPSYLFEQVDAIEIKKIFKNEQIEESKKLTVGMIICGFNLTPPYDKWPREDEEYNELAIVIEHIVNNLGARVILMSHSNGFDLIPNFKLKNGRDYPIVKQLQQVVKNRGKVRNMDDVICIDNAYIPAKTKAIIGQFDMFITGRVHASVASVTQCVPTVFITYENGENSGKTLGFASIAQLQDYVSEPAATEIINKVNLCFSNREAIRIHLENVVPKIQSMARQGFDIIREQVAGNVNNVKR
jgi:colanic acid/amylovoran biosynthesis protein